MSEQPAIVIGGGPAGLRAAEALVEAGRPLLVCEAMPSVGRKFLLAGKGGLNLTHSEDYPAFLSRFGARAPRLRPFLDELGPAELRAWAARLGVETFVGTSGRVFPADMKAAPLLRSWLRQLRAAGARLEVRWRWVGWGETGLLFETPTGIQEVPASVTVLALGGGSWPQLGSTGAWVPLLRQKGVSVSPLRPSNCGFETAWSDHFRQRFAGQPVKSVRASFGDQSAVGELVVTEHGIEGSLVYALSAALRDELEANGQAVLHLDLAPHQAREKLRDALARPRGSKTLSNHLRARAHIDGVKAGLLRELPVDLADPEQASSAIKDVPLRLTATRPLAEAISSAGGIPFDELDEQLMLRKLPGVFCAGEMLDWEAPTGGYLLTACFATGRAAGLGAARWLAR